MVWIFSVGELLRGLTVKRKFDWETPAGITLRRLVEAIRVPTTLTVFGSAPLQMEVEQNLLSQDVDIFSDSELEEIVKANSLGVGQSEPGIQICHELNFRATPNWALRAQIETVGFCRVIFPHPTDILIGKLHRLEEKDLEAFKIVIQKTGHPTEQELLTDLQKAVELFKPSFDEEHGSNLQINTAYLWETLFGRSLDVKQEIIIPALKARRIGYGHDIPSQDYREVLSGKIRQ